VLILTQDRCTVCAEHTTALEIILDTPEELQGDMGHVESSFGPFGHTVLVSVQDRCTVCAKQTIGSEIILDAHDSTPR
jgi:hypothetical protein